MAIVIVGLGPGDPALLTLEADRVLRSAGAVWLRTGRHPCVEYLRAAGVRLQTFDQIYEQEDSLPQVYDEIAARVLAEDDAAGAGNEVVFAVPGHPLVGEATTRRILEAATQGGRPVRIVEGLSFIEPALTLLGVDALDGLQIVDALDLIQQPYPLVDTGRGALVGHVYSRGVASDVKLALGELYPDEHPVSLIQAAGAPEGTVAQIPLYELDRQPGIDHRCSLYVPPLPYAGSWLGLQALVARLRGPGGCPWDQEQTHRTLRTHLLDETYEVLEALDRDDMDELCIELGDLALQIALHIQIAREAGEFTPTEVFAGIISKLRRRHPHVFGDVQVSGAGEVMVNWEQIKRREKGSKDNSRLFDGVPASLPALAQALTYQQRAARVGYRPANGEALARLLEEWLAGAPEERAEALLGDLLFALVASVRERHPALNPESALREANARFAARFRRDQTRGSCLQFKGE